MVLRAWFSMDEPRSGQHSAVWQSFVDRGILRLSRSARQFRRLLTDKASGRESEPRAPARGHCRPYHRAWQSRLSGRLVHRPGQLAGDSPSPVYGAFARNAGYEEESFTMLESLIGPAAGVSTSGLWTFTSLLFTAAAKRIGPTAVNTYRIALAIVLHAVTYRLISGEWIPDVASRQVVYLALSGIIGLSIGDQALFVAFVDLGPRLAVLIMTTSPLAAALFGWLVLGEAFGGIAWLGITLTICGVGWVVMERPAGDVPRRSMHRSRGVLLAVVAAVCQAGGLLLSKQGMGHGWLGEDQHLDPQAATLIRMLFAGFGMMPIVAMHVLRDRRRRVCGMAPPRKGSRYSGLWFTACGTLVGPYLGVWMSLVASDRAPLGIAQTLCSLSPVFILPFAAKLYGERISRRTVLGALIAIAGSALLFVKS